ncbi:uncharacterized protein [Palaemon carinicauda]|uniref:uncharacterized protein n=1 Tax=Palaemon carinicauda TaxID=392227 RepID=UPI0035B65835
MPLFSVDDFHSDPESHLTSIVVANKNELLLLAAKFGVALPPNAKKDVVRNYIVQHCISEDLVDSSEGSKYIVDVGDKSSDVEYMKLAIHLGNVKQHRAEPLGDKDGRTDRGLFCNYYKKEGHIISNCPNPACKKGEVTENRAPVKMFPGHKSDTGKEPAMHWVSQDKILFEKSICNGTISLHSSDKPIKVRMLRDTGSNQSILIKSVVPNLTLLDENVIVRDLTDAKLLPLTEVFMVCPYVTGKVKMAVREGNFPLPNVQVLLGNDLAGELLLPNLIMYETPGIIEESENEKESKVEGCVNVTTRSMVNNDRVKYLQHLNEEQRCDIENLLRQYEDVCSDNPRECSVISHDIELLPGTRPIRQNYYRINFEKRKVMQEEVEYLLKHKLAVPSKSPWASPCLLVPKSNGKRMVNDVIRDLDGVYGYLDDILVVSDTWEEHLGKLKALLDRFRRLSLTINLAKSNFASARVKYLGHVIGSGEILPKTTNIKAILDYPLPTNRKEVDACDYGVGAVLLQEKPETNLFHPVSYYSCRLKKHQRLLSTVEKELLPIVQALQKYEVYVSTNNPITVYTDHNPLVLWSLYLQNFNISVQHIHGQDNGIADALSRTPVPGNIVPS